MNKVTSYLKNVGKSISYATVDIASKKLIPEVRDFTDTNQEIFKAVYATVGHSKKSMNYGKKLATDSQIYKDINKGIKNALDDIKTGNFYNKAREDAAFDAVAESMFGGFDDIDTDFNFDDDFDDGSLDNFQDSIPKEVSVTKGDMIVADSISKSTNLSAQLISKTVANTSNTLVKTQLAATNMMMAQNVELMAGLRTSIAGMHESINSILRFAQNEITTQINNESKYFETTTSIMQENNAILKEMLEMQRNMYKAQDQNKSDDIFGKVFSGGTLDVKEYFKAIGKNIKNLDKTGIGSMLTTDMGSGTMLSQMMSNPLGFVMTSIVEKFIPMNVAKSIATFSKTLGNVFPAMIAKLNDWKNNKGGIFGLLGDIFGLEIDTKRKLDTGKYKKDAVPFDGITRKAIVDVIPEHLSRIEAILSGGKSQRVYDYHTGKWISAKDIEKKQKEEYDYLLRDSLSDLSSELREFMDTMKYDSKKKESVNEDLIKMMKYVFEQKSGAFNPNEIKKNIKNYKFNNTDDMSAILDMISKMPTYKIASVSKNAIENQKRYADFLRDAELQGDSIYRKLHDGSYDDYDIESIINLFTGSGKNNRKGSKSSSKSNYKYNKNSNDLFEKASRNARDKASKEMEDDFSGFGTAYKKNSKWQKAMDQIPGDSFIEKFKNANDMQSRFALIMGSLNDIAQKPAAMLTGLIGKADQAIYNLLFKAETNEVGADGKRIKGLVDAMTEKMTKKWEEMTQTLNDKVIEPLAKKYGLDEKLDKFKTRAKEGLLGKVQKDENGRVIKNEYGFAKRSNGLLTPTMYALQKDFRGVTGYTKNSIIDVLSPLINDPTVADFRASMMDKRYQKTSEKDIKKLQSIVDSLSPEQKAELGNDRIKLLKKLGITGLARGGKVTKAGLIAVSEGEEVTVKNKDSRKIRQNQIGESNRTLAAIYDVLLNPNADMSKHEAQFGIPGFAEGGKAEGATSFEELDSILKGLDDGTKKYYKSQDNISRNRRSNGPIAMIVDYLKKTFNLDQDPKKEKSEINKMMTDILSQMEGKGTDMASKAIIGGGLGLLFGAPLIGAGLGAAISLTKNSNTVQKLLFGKVDEKTGEVKEGLISKKMQDTFKDHTKDLGKYAVTGAVGSLFLPFGPLAGAAIGAGIGLLKNSSTMNKLIFGEEIINSDGSKSRDNNGLLTPDRLKKIKDYFPRASVGAIAGLALGPFGLLGNAAIGAGVGMLTGTEDFKDLIFGEKDSSGDRFGGIKGALDEHFVQPLKDFGTNFKDDFFGFVKESMIDPLNRAITPIASEISFQTRRVVFGIPKMFAKLGKDYIATPLMDLLGDRVVDPLARLTRGFFGGIFNRAKGLISLPFRAIGGIGDHLRKKQIRQGRDEAGNAKSRIQFAKTRKMGQYDYRKFDETLAENSDNQDFLEEVTARTGMLAYGAEHFEKEVKNAGKELSKVLSKYYKLGWFSKDKAGYNRIKRYIKDNDIESAIQELSNIQKSRPTGGKLDDKEAESAINQFTAANEKYQIAKQARDKFGNINKEDNEAWMEQQFGKNWRKMDAKRLFKYSSRELSDLTKQTQLSKADLFKDPTKLVTRGDELINNTLGEIKDILDKIQRGEWMDSKSSKEYQEGIKIGTEKATNLRNAKKIKIKENLTDKNISVDDDTVNKLYTNEDIFNLVMFAAGKGFVYDIDTIKNLCEMDLDKDDIQILKSMPHLGKLPKEVLDKYLSNFRNDHGTFFKNGFFGTKKFKMKNLKLINDALEKGVNIESIDDARMITSGGLHADKYDHQNRNNYFQELNRLGLVGKVIEINGEMQKLTKEMILKDLTYDQLDQIISKEGGNTPFKEKTSIKSAIYNNTGSLRKVTGTIGKGLGLGAAGLLASPILLPLGAIGALGAGAVGLGKGVNFLGKNIGDIKNLGIKGFINDKIIKHKSDDIYNSETLGASDNGKYRYESGEYGTKRYVKIKGEWQLDTSDSETQETLKREEESQKEKKSFFSSINSMKDGILGLFNRNKEKDEEEEKEPWYKKLFNFDLGDSKLGKGLKFGGILLGGMTAIGAIKNLWDNRTPGGLVDRIGSAVGDFVGPYVTKVQDWFTSSGEYEGKGLPAFMEEHVYPNLFTGFNVIFQKVLPALLKSFIISLPTIIKAGISGIGKLITDALGWGRDDSHDNDNKINSNSIKIGDQSASSLASSATSGGSGGTSTWISKIMSDAETVANDMIGTANAVNTGTTYKSSTLIGTNTKTNNETVTGSTSNTSTTSNNAANEVLLNKSQQQTSTNSNSGQMTQDQQAMLSEPMTFGDGLQMYKKDSKGNLVPMTGQDYFDAQGQIQEFYTETGVKYTYDPETGRYLSEKGDTYTDIDDGFISRMSSVFGRSLATGKTMGIMRLGKGLSSKFGNTMLGKVVKGGLNIMDTTISHIPFIKTPYKIGKAGFKGLSSITSGISKMGVTGNTYIDYATKALKEGYKPSEIMKDIGSDIVGNVKNSKLGQTASSIKNSKATKVITNVAKNAKDTVLNSNTGKKITELTSKASKASKSTINLITDWVKDGLNYILNNNTIFSKIKEGLKKSGKKSSEKAAKKVVKEMIEKLISKFSQNIVGKLTKNVITKLTAAIGSAGIITAVFSIVDFTVGYDQAESILGIEEVSFVQRLLAGLINIITNELFFGLVDAKTIVDWCVDIIFPFFDIDIEGFKKQRAEAEANTKKYNQKEGTNISTEERLKQDKWTWKVTKAWDGATKAVGGAVSSAGDWAAEHLDPFGWFDSKNEKKKKKEAAKFKSAKSTMNAAPGIISKSFSAIKDAGKSISENVKKQTGSNSSTTTENTALAGTMTIAEQQLNQFDVLSQNLDSAYTITDLQLGKIYGFTDSQGNPISLSQGIENYNSKSTKGLTTFGDVLNTISGSMSNMVTTLGTTTRQQTKQSSGLFGSIANTIGSVFSSFTGSGSGKDKGFISQVDPQYRNIKFNKFGDSELQTLGDSGCAPATAANVLNFYAGRGRDEMTSAADAALRYKENNGGVTPDYFENYLGSKGIGTYSTFNKNEMLSGINSGQPTILLGADPTNKSNTPYGSRSSHYVLATGTDGKGNAIVQDPESRKPNALYPIKDLLNQSQLGMITGRGSGKVNVSRLRSKLGKLGFGKGTENQDLASWSELTDEQIDAFIKKKRKDSPFTGAAINKAAKASGLDPRYILAHAAVESAWGTSNYGAKHHNYFGIGAFDSNPDNAINYGNSGMEAGLVNGAVWIRENYYDKGQTTIYKMRYNGGKHEYCTSNTWVNSIANIMDQMPKNTNAVMHTPNGNIQIGDGSESSVNTLASMFAALPTAYFGEGLMSLFGLSSSSSTSTGSSSNVNVGPGVEGAAKQMEVWANDPNVGYDQKYRWGEKGDYDCSGAVITAYEKAGIPVKSKGGASYTGNMLNAFKKTGFTDITNQVNLQTGDGLIRGDVLLNPGRHTAMYIGNGQEAEASINEHGTTTGGQPGDQTEKEFLVRSYRNYPWNNVLRYSGSGSGKNKNVRFLSGRGTGNIANSTLLNNNYSRNNISLQQSRGINIRTSSLPSLSRSTVTTTGTNGYSNYGTSSSVSSTDKLLSIIIEVLQVIANNSEKLSEIVSLLSKALDLNLTDNDISGLSSNNAQIKNKIANALKVQGSANGLGDSIMNASTESLATAMYSIARA